MRGKLTLALSLLTLALAAAIPVASLDAQRGGVGLTVWVDADFKGANHTFLDDTPDVGAVGLARQISSLRPSPGETWEVCSGVNYSGRCRVMPGTVSNLDDVSWNDIIMSVRRVRRPTPGSSIPGGDPGRSTLPPARGLELYAGVDYSGQRLVLTEPTGDFRRREFNDRAISLRVPRGETWEVCINANYDECRVVSEDVPDLAALGLSRNISSARLRPTGRGRGRGFPFPGGRQRLVLYERVNFAGRSLTLEDDEPNLRFFSNDAGSVEVQGGRWQLCDQPRYGGRCATITESERDLRRLGLRDRVSSVRRQ